MTQLENCFPCYHEELSSNPQGLCEKPVIAKSSSGGCPGTQVTESRELLGGQWE